MARRPFCKLGGSGGQFAGLMDALLPLPPSSDTHVGWLNLCVFSICCQGSVHVPCLSRGFIHPWDSGCFSYILSRYQEYLLFIYSGSPVYLFLIHSGSPVYLLLIHCLYCRSSTQQVEARHIFLFEEILRHFKKVVSEMEWPARIENSHFLTSILG